MKKHFIFIVLITFCSANAAIGQQWATNGTHIYNTNTGNVGIGTGTSFTPTSKFHINNGSNTASIMAESAYAGTDNHSMGNLRLKNSTTGDMFNITLRKNGTIDEMLQSCYIAADSPPWREFIYFNFGTRKYEMRNGIMDAEYLNSGNLLFNNLGRVGIGTQNPQSSAALDITSTSKGLLPPRMTNAQMNAIQNPANGLVVFCTDCSSDGGRIALYLGGSWYTLSINNCTSPPSAPPSEGTHVPSATQITWNWNATAGATGYKWNTADNPFTALDLGNSLTKTESGLTCETPYARYVWAYNACGNSASVPLTATTTDCWACGDPITVNHVAGNVAPVSKTVNYGTVTDIPGEPSKCWITSNLGADHQATAFNDATEESAGWYWQFNRKQGYKHDGATRTPNTAWISSIDENSDWVAANDPCTLELGNGWRLPTSTEWINVDASENWTDINDPWNSALKIHASGYLAYYGNGLLLTRGEGGNYSSSAQNSNSYDIILYFYSGFCNTVPDNDKANGMTSRCLQD
jgi:hypothetical protein